MPESLELEVLEAVDNNNLDAVRALINHHPGLETRAMSDGNNILSLTFQLNPDVAEMLINEFPDSMDFKVNDHTMLEMAVIKTDYFVINQILKSEYYVFFSQLQHDIAQNKNIIALALQHFDVDIITLLYDMIILEMESAAINNYASVFKKLLDRYFSKNDPQNHANIRIQHEELNALVEILLSLSDINHNEFLTQLCVVNPALKATILEYGNESLDPIIIKTCATCVAADLSPDEIQQFYHKKLLTAIKENRMDLIKLVLTECPQVINIPDPLLNISPLGVAIRSKSTEIIDLVLGKALETDSRCILTGTHAGLTPLTLAAQYCDLATFQTILRHMPDINALDAFDRSALAYAYHANPDIYHLLQNLNAEVSIDQSAILSKLSLWLISQSQANLEAQGYDLDIIKKLKIELVSGHCSGFSWIHRIYMNNNQYDYFYSQMRSIAMWDPSMPIDPILNKSFSELLQVIIYAQQGESSALSQNEMILKQASHHIARDIQPATTTRLFIDTTMLHSDGGLKKYSAEKLKKFIDKYSASNGMIYLGGRFKGYNAYSQYLHAVDVGASTINGKPHYWLYNSNSSIGRKDYDNFDDFFIALNAALNYSPPSPSLMLELAAYTPAIEYNYKHSNSLGNCREDTVVNIIRNGKDIYDYFEIELASGNYLYVKIEDGKFAITDSTNSQSSMDIDFESPDALLRYLDDNHLKPQNVIGIEIIVPTLPIHVSKVLATNFARENKIYELKQLIRRNPMLIKWIELNPEIKDLLTRAQNAEIQKMPSRSMDAPNLDTRVGPFIPAARKILERKPSDISVVKPSSIRHFRKPK